MPNAERALPRPPIPNEGETRPLLDQLVERAFQRHTKTKSVLEPSGIRSGYRAMHAAIETINSAGIDGKTLFFTLRAQTRLPPQDWDVESMSPEDARDIDELFRMPASGILARELVTRHPEVIHEDERRKAYWANRGPRRDSLPARDSVVFFYSGP